MGSAMVHLTNDHTSSTNKFGTTNIPIMVNITPTIILTKRNQVDTRVSVNFVIKKFTQPRNAVTSPHGEMALQQIILPN